MYEKEIKRLQDASCWKIGNYTDFMEDINKKQSEIEDNLLKLELKIERLKGEWSGMLEGICMWDIPQKLKEKLEKKIKLLKEDIK